MKKKVWIPLVVLAVLAITYFSGPVPEPPEYSDEWVEVPQSLPDLEQYITEREDSLPVREDNDARIIWHGSGPQVTEYSFVYLHGFAGSYRDGYPLNLNVAEAFGANIYLDRWAGHGMVPPESFDDFSPEAAWESAREALAIGQRIGRKVIIMSTSTGGALAIKLAATFPDSVHALVNIAPNIRDDQEGAFLLNSPWGHEIAYLVSLGENRRIRHTEEEALQYWDTIYPADALVELQVLVETTTHKEIYEEVECPVLTLYYHKNFLEQDDHVEVDDYPRMHRNLSTPDSLKELISLEEPGTHFIGSDIKSADYLTAQRKIINFLENAVGMKPADADDSNP